MYFSNKYEISWRFCLSHLPPKRGGEKYSSHLLVRSPWHGNGKFEIKCIKKTYFLTNIWFQFIKINVPIILPMKGLMFKATLSVSFHKV